MSDLLPLVLVLRLWHLGVPSEPDPRPWRLVDTEAVHVGARPAALISHDETAFAATLQVRCAFCGGFP